MTSRRFAPLFWTQFLSAFNDNFVRNMLAMLILFRLGEEHAGALVTLAVALFVLPSIFLSARRRRDRRFARQGADRAAAEVRRDPRADDRRRRLHVRTRSCCSTRRSFGSGVIAALFGPIKYGILPDHLETRELPAGNALVEGATFLAILLGVIIGGYAASHDRSSWSVVAQLMIIAMMCWGASTLIPATGVGAPDLKVERNIAKSSVRLVRELAADRRLWIGGLAVSWFWMTGAIALSLVPVLIKHKIGGGIDVETAVMALFAAASASARSSPPSSRTGASTCCRRPSSALMMAVFLIDLGYTAWGMPQASGTIDLLRLLHQRHGHADRLRRGRHRRSSAGCSSCRSFPPCSLGRARTGARA